MERKQLVLLFMLVFIGMYSIVYSALGPNMVTNSNFEIDENEDGRPDGWNYFSRGGSDISIEEVEGSSCVKIDKAESDTWIGIEQEIWVQGGATYLVKIRMKVDAAISTFTVGAYGYTGVPYQSEFINVPAAIGNAGVRISSGFVEYEVEWKIPERVNSIMYRMESYHGNEIKNKATIWIDYFELYRLDNTPPEPAQNIKSSRLDDGSIKLDWQVKKAADGDLPERFNIYKGTNSEMLPDENNIIAEGVTGTSWVDRSTKGDRNRYYYIMEAFDPLGNAALSEVVTAWGVSELNINVSIDDGSSPAGTKVMLQSENHDFQFLLEQNGFLNLSLFPEGEYRVEAYRKGCRVWSDTLFLMADIDEELEIILESDKLPPNEPEGLTMSTPSPGLVKLTWGEPRKADDGDTAAYYYILRSQGDNIDPEQAQLVAQLVTELEYIDTKVKGGEHYRYFVVSVDLAENPSDFPAISDSVMVIRTPIPEVFGPNNQEQFVDQLVKFCWGHVEDVKEYEIEVAADQYFNKRVASYPVGNRRTYQLNAMMDEGVWFWRVRPLFNTGVIGDFTEPATFVQIRTNPGWGGSGIIAINPQIFAPKKSNEPCLVNVVLDTTSEVTIRIYNSKGKTIRTIVETALEEGSQVYSWDGKDDIGNYVLNGIYFCEIVTKATGSRPVRNLQRIIIMN